MNGPTINRVDDFAPEDFDEDAPYCECDNEPDEEESASNICKSCGKLLT
jgi:hypothetical protein